MFPPTTTQFVVAMRIASSPTLRIAAGWLLIVLASVVGYTVVRQLSARSPEALLKRAEEKLLPDDRTAEETLNQPGQFYFTHRRQLSKALPSEAGRTPTHRSSSKSIPDLSPDFGIRRLAMLRHLGKNSHPLKTKVPLLIGEEPITTINFDSAVHRAAEFV